MKRFVVFLITIVISITICGCSIVKSSFDKNKDFTESLDELADYIKMRIGKIHMLCFWIQLIIG